MKKRALTLIEIMIVIFLITLITGAIGYSMKGSLEKGRAFKTERGEEQLHDLLLMAVAEGYDPTEAAKNPAAAVAKLGLAKDPSQLVKDGWNEPFEVKLTAAKNDFTIRSAAYQRYQNRLKPREAAAAETDDE